MANTKISQLPGVTVPLSGTEVLPVVQSGTTSQVSIDDFVLNSVLPSGTANGVLYLNGSKIATSGSALTFDGSTLSVSNNLSVGSTISETVGGTQYPVVSQADLGTAPNEIPLNQYLGNLAYQDAGSIAGNVVIGGTVTSAGSTSTSPSVISVNSSTDALRITQTGTGNALVVEDSANPDSTPTVIDATGRVVIGRTTGLSSTPLGYANLQIIGTDTQTSQTALWNFDNTAAASWLSLNKSRGAIGVNSIVQSGDTLGRVAGFGADGTDYIRAAQISFEVDGTPGTNDMPGRLVFSTTADGASSPTERMRINSAGNVGIGTSGGSTVQLSVSGTNSIDTSYSLFYGNAQVSSANTASGNGFYSQMGAAATATTTELYQFRAGQGTFTAGAAIGNQYGFRAEASLTGATNNYGFYSNIASGTGRWNFYASGTAANYFAGDMKFGSSVTETVYTLGTSGTLALNPANGTIQTCAAAGNITFTDSLASGQSISLRLTNGASYTINWPTINWVTSAGNAAPTLTANDTVVFWKISTTLYGAYVGSGV